ncbi:MAG: metal ABC transporter ATP-binding protein [Culicoidibacterales bacterium]
MISVKNVTYQIDNQVILSDISFTIDEGDFAAVIGPNGSGKSTLLKCLLGMNMNYQGKIEYGGLSLSEFLQVEKIGYVAQHSLRYNNAIPVSVQEVIATGCDNLRGNAEEISQALTKVGLNGFEKKRLSELSGGQQQRVFIARALVMKPKLLVLDEPTVGIDQARVKEFYELMMQLHREGMTIVLVSHDVHLMNTEITKVIAINQGVAFNGNFDEYRRYHANYCECGDSE